MLCLGLAAVADAQPRFQARLIQDHLVQASDVCPADLDGDGDPDLAATLDAGGRILWLQNDGATPPGFAPQPILTIPGPRCVDVGDLDGDGDLDLATGLSADTHARDAAVYWHENTGGSAPSFLSARITNASDTVGNLQIIDLNGDGHRDILFVAHTEGLVAWARNDGAADPTFTVHSITTALGNAIDARAADMDGDGDLDVIAADLEYHALHLFLNNGETSPHWAARVVAQTPLPYAIDIADLDGDGDRDILTGSGFGGTFFQWYENSGSVPPLFTAHIVSEAEGAVRDIRAGDLDNDEDLDIVAVHYDAGRLLWYENLGGPTPVFTAHGAAAGEYGPYRIHIGDLDSDGDADLVAALIIGNQVKWYENRLYRQFDITGRDILRNSPLFGAPSDGFHVTVGDANNDGVEEFVIACQAAGGTGKLGLVRTREGAWDAGTVLLTAPSWADGVANPLVGDPARDGIQRLFYNFQGATSGSLESARLIGAVPAERSTVHGNSPHGGFYAGAIADLDQDAAKELYLFRVQKTGRLSAHRWNGRSYTFEDLHDTGHAHAACPAVGRVLDATEEVLLHVHGPESLHMLRCDAGYTSSRIFHVPGQTIESFVLGRLDGSPGAQVLVAVSDGNATDFTLLAHGSFTPVSLGSLNHNITSLCAADLNGDGQDEGYAAVATGDLYRITVAMGVELIETIPGVRWTDLACARLPELPGKHLVAAGVEENGNLRLRVYEGKWYDGHQFGSDVVGYWPLDNHLLDVSGNHLHASTASVDPATGRFYQGFAFNGVDSFIELPGYPESEALTIAAWVKVDALPGYPAMVFMRRADWQDQQMNLTVSGHAQFTVLRGSTANHNDAFSPNPVALGQWVHLAGTVDADLTRVYVNGRLARESASGGAIAWDAAVRAVMIGRHPTEPESFHGLIDEVVLFNRVLTGDEIAALAQDGNNDQVADFWQGAPLPLYGDVNCDGVVDAVDVQQVAEVDSGLRPSVNCHVNADVNCDGEVTLADALLIAQIANGLRPPRTECP